MGSLKRRFLTSHSLLGMLAVATVCGSMAVEVHSATYYWDTNGGTAGAGGTPNGTWGTSNSYWSTSSSGTATSLQSSTSAADDLYFVAGPGTNSGENAFTVTVAGSQNADSLVFQSSGTATLSGAGTISLWGSGGITVSQFGYGFTPQGPVTISPDIVLQASQTWINKSSNRLTISGSVLNGNSLTIAGPGKTLVSGVMSGSGGLAKLGVGTLTITGSSTYTGGTTIAGGVLQLGDGTSGHDGALPATGLITNNAALAFDLSGPQNFSASISGSGSLTKSGTGTLTLTGSSSFSGGTTISAGTLQLGNGAAGCDGLLSGSGAILNNATLLTNFAGSQTLASVISGGGSLVKTGSGMLTLTQANSFSGGTTITAGTLQLGNGGSDGSLAGIGGVNDNSALVFNLVGSQYYAGIIGGSGALLKLGTGSLTLAGTNNTYGGGTTVSGGVLAVTATSALPGYGLASKVAVGSGGTLVLNVGGSGSWSATNLGTLLSSNGTGFASGSMLGIDTSGGSSAVSYAGVISGSMGLTKFGLNALILTSSNGYSGSTVISGGTLQLGDGATSNGYVSAAGGIVNNAALVYDPVGAQTYWGTISGSGNLAKVGGSTLTLAGSNTFSGNTTIGAGTLILANSSALVGSTLVAPPSGSLVFDQGVSSNAFSLGGLSGTGSIALQNNASPPAAIALAVGGNNASTIYAGVLSGSGSFTKMGSGTLTLTKSNSFSGGTTISGGILQLGNGLSGQDGSLLSTGMIVNNAVLNFDLNASESYAGSISGSGSTIVGGGTLTLVPGASLAASSGSLHVGDKTGATLNIQNASVTLGGELDVNFASTASGSASTAYLNLQGGTLSVAGPTVVGHARMDTSATATSSLVSQGAGLFSASGAMTIGQAGLAQSIYSGTGGTLRAYNGLTVGAKGDGLLSISNAGNVVVSGTQGLAIGSDPSGATSGTVTLSGGSLATGNLILGNGGVGTFIRSGGALSATGSLVAAGAGTLVLNGAAGSVATYFAGQLTQNNAGTLVIIPQSGQPSGNEALTFGQSSTLTNNIAGPWAVRQVSGTNTQGDYLTLTGTTAPYSLVTASTTNGYTSTNFAGSSGTSVVNVTGSPTIGDTSAYAVKFGSGSTTTLDGTLSLVSGGMILNGCTVTGSGAVKFFNADTSSSVTGMIFAGSSTASTIAVPLSTSLGVVKFGPGNLIVSGNNSSLTGGILVSSGVLTAASSGALGPGGGGNDVLVTAGAELDLQNNIALPAVEMSISGTGGGSNSGGLHNISGTNSLAGVLNLANNLRIATDSGTLTLLGPIQGSYNVTKAGTGTLALSADSSHLYSGGITVLAGVLDVSNSGALGIAGGGGSTTIGNSATLTVHGNVSLPAIPITLGGSGVGNGGVLQNLQDDNSMASPLSLSAATQIGTNAGSLTLLGQISGNYPLTKTGSGMLVLANAANSFGPLTVTAGTLSIPSMNNAGSAGPLGLATSPVALGTSGGTTTFDYSGFGDSSTRAFSIATGSTGVFQVDYPGVSLSLSGSISGGGSLIQAGYGTLAINGSASYSGSTCVSQGVLAIGPGGALTNTSSITVCPYALLQLTNSGSSQLSSSASISLQAGALTFYGNGSTTSSGQIAGNLYLGPGENDITVTCLSGSNQPWLRFASLPSHTTGATVNFITSNAQVQFATSPSLANGILGGYAYDNGSDFAMPSGSGPYTVQAYSAYVTGDLGSLSTSATTNAKPSGTQSVVTAAKTINSLNLAGTIGVQMSGTGALTLISGGLIANTSGVVRGGILTGNGELTINTVQDIAISSTILDNSGPTALVKTGPGTLTLSGTTSYTGQTFLNEGTIVFTPPVNTSYAGAIHGLGNLTKSGTATLTLSGTSDYSGTTTITGGALCVNGEIGPSSFFPASPVSLQSSAVLSGSGIVGDVTATGGAIAFASSAAGIASTVTVASGTLSVGKSGIGNFLNTSGGLYVTGGGALAASPSTSATIVGNIAYSSSASSTYAGMISGTGSVLTFDAPAGTTLTLASTATSTFGGVVLEGGTLKIATTAALGSNPLTINGGTLDLTGWTNFMLTSLAGSGGAIETSSGSLTLTLNPPSGMTDEYSGSIAKAGSGTLALSKTGDGTLILSGSDSYTGGTEVHAGILQVGSSTAIPDGSSLTIDSGGTLTFGVGSSPSAAAAIPAAMSAREQVGSTMAVPVPEPGTLALLLASLVGLGLLTLRGRIGG